MGSMTPTIESEVQQIRAAGGAMPGWRLRVTGRSTPTKGDPTEFDVAWLVGTVEAVDHAGKVVAERGVSEARRLKGYSIGNMGRMDDMSAMRPFARELGAASYEIGTAEEVGGVSCDVVTAVTGTNARTTWWFGVEDHLPRRSKRLIPGGKGEDSFMVFEVSDLRLNQASTGAAKNLRVTVPEGYTEDRPVRPVAAPPEAAAKPAETAAATPAAPAAPAGPTRAPEFELEDETGAKVSLASLQGSVVVLEFAGSWAVACRESKPELATLAAAKEPLGVKFYSIAVRERTKERAIAEHRKVGGSVKLLLNGDRVARDYGVRAYPSYAVVDKQGLLVLGPKVWEGAATKDELGRAVDAALVQDPKP
ncbi:MAG: TlpA family protein disulfide reductase [Leptolyngbya sp. PLA1]|nr:TlpA family protein disulfide reductase [Leptolyngbya sp. PLA1]